MDTKLALITGGTGYLGTAITKELVQRGYDVVQLSRSSAEYPCDITNPSEVRAAVARAVERFGPIDAVIHAASAPIERVARTEASAQDIEAQRSVAVVGAQNLYEAVAPHMQAGGTFVAITSDATKSTGELKMGSYAEAKREMEAYVDSLHAPFRTLIYSVGFLPGGLNDDLPEQVRDFFAAKSKPLEEVAVEIADLVQNSVSS